MRLFQIAVAVQQEEQVLHPDRLAGLPHAREEGADHVPDFRPALGRTLTERCGVLGGAQDRPEGIVVDLDEVGAPEDHHGIARLQGVED